MPIGTQTVTDNFDRANQSPIAGNWTDDSSAGSHWAIVSNQASMGASAGSDATAIWNTWADGDDQYSQGEITAVGGGAGAGPGVMVRHSTSATTATYYRLMLDQGGNIELAKMVTGGYTFLASRTVTYIAGTKLGLAIQGNTMTIWYGGVQQGVSYTDVSSPITTGVPGICYSSILTTAIVDNWDAGNFAVVVVGVPGLYTI